MDDASLHPAEDTVHNSRARDDRAHGNESAAQRLGDAHDVRLDVGPMLIREPSPAAPEARLHFVENEQRAVFATELLSLREISIRDDLARLALNRLDDERGRLPEGKGFLERGQIVEGNFLGAGKKIAEAFAEEIGAVDRKRAGREAVKPVIAVNN